MLRDPENIELQIIIELLGTSVGHLVEIGCGDGRLSGGLREISSSMTALDPGREALSRAAQTIPEKIDLLAGSGEELPLADGCADAVLFTLSLHHQNPVRALDEAQRVLKKNGRILVLEPVEHSLLNMLFSVINNESDAYERAEMAINGSALKEIRTGSVREKWVFEDFPDMVEYLFDYCDLEPDEEKKQQMAQLLGERTADKPLAVEDITRFWLLQEGPGS
jgi:SAM-dependent methyltransferase